MLTYSGDPNPREVRRALHRAALGRSLSAEELVPLLAVRGEALTELCGIAAGIRDRALADQGRPATITYSRNVFVPVTRLCRDRCHYCTFVQPPAKVAEPYLSPDEVLDICRAGATAGCKEALFTLGDRPEARWPEAAQWLESKGYASTIDYLRSLAIKVLEETGLLPHLNPGVLSWEELQRLKPVSASIGMMLETTSERLFSEPGNCHYASPDKEPAVRLRTLHDAGRVSVPFTTGLLVGIGENLQERADSVLQLRTIARLYSGIQEVIVQNFRAKPDTAMRAVPDLAHEDYLAMIAVARIVLGPGVSIQAPPNLTKPESLADLVAAGIDDWGGVSPVTVDHINPERAWPHVDTLLSATQDAGFRLMERLAVRPEFVLRGEPWIHPRVADHVAALVDPATGLAREGSEVIGRPWQDRAAPPDDPGGEATSGVASSGRTDLHVAIDREGRRTMTRSDQDAEGGAFGNWEAVRAEARRVAAPTRLPADVKAALAAAESRPGALSDREALALASCDGAALRHLCSIADALRADIVGDDVTFVVNRNINFTNVCYTGCRFCAFAQRRDDADSYTLSLDQVFERSREAWEVGATEVCMQGGIDPRMPETYYFDLAKTVKSAAPELHLHAFSPMEVINGATRMGIPVKEWLQRAREAGVDSLPGTAAEILDDEVRWVLTKGKLPTSAWVEVITTAHRLGIPTTATMMYGHVDHPGHWVAHLKLLARIQAETDGFTEFVPLPFIHHNAPIYLAGLARPGPSQRENLAVHALARIMLHGLVDHVQCSWVKLGPSGCATMLGSGADDLGGTLMEETISRMAGSSFGSLKSVAEMRSIADIAGRPLRQRTTTYGVVPTEAAGRTARFDDFVERSRRSLPLVGSPPCR
ncbi:MAG: bifunctional FO biosynthesis protein CofGH [Intrasporangium sp.]|uniref:bifunctional FO biosynthesis protein CofGH n=1 Tax=Intrasporangium sp. TaxID=1925024 RepID=UPI00264721D0|nr:bifunctional FO biosynthesis protein CofGH [Intrasporangium sp.]MDN5794120.1 bifunctional FO biosynthesis protein CofGH [Intrasporangium sp.]